MKARIKIIALLSVVVLFILSINFLLKSNNASAEGYSNTCEIVMERDTNRVLHQSNAHKKAYMASTTKILTAIVSIENSNINDIVKIPKNAVGIEGSSIYLIEGEKLTIKELLYGLMLRSGNDCAVALALKISGSIEKFAELMNNTAKKIGATNSNFVNPHGLHDDNHYTTAYDLGLISCYAMKNDVFREIVGTKKITISNETKDYKRVLINKNKMLNSFDGCTGIKTGYTKKAGRCLVSSAKRDNLELISVVLNCGPMWEVSSNNLTNCFNLYKNYKVIEADFIVDFVIIEDKKIGVETQNDVILPLSKTEKDNLTSKITYKNNLTLPIKKGEEIGCIEFYVLNNLIFCQKLYTINDSK